MGVESDMLCIIVVASSVSCEGVRVGGWELRVICCAS